MPAEHIWPALLNDQPRIALSARSKSASAKTMNGDLPPSSVTEGTTLAAAAWATLMPVGTEPVKVTWSMPGCPARAAPVPASPGTTFSTPGGSPHSSAIRPTSSGVRGASGEGLSTTVQPAASAGAEPRAVFWSG